MMPNAAMPQWRVPLRALGRVGDDNVRREIGVICAGARSGLEIIQRADHGLGRLLHMREDHRRLQTAVTDQQLEWPNVCPRRREVGGKATPQRISADVMICALVGDGGPHDVHFFENEGSRIDECASTWARRHDGCVVVRTRR